MNVSVTSTATSSYNGNSSCGPLANVYIQGGKEGETGPQGERGPAGPPGESSEDNKSSKIITHTMSLSLL